MIDIENLDTLLESQEKMVKGLRPGTEKKSFGRVNLASNHKQVSYLFTAFLPPVLRLIQSLILLRLN